MIFDTRKSPWYLDLTPAEMERIIAAVPALLEVAEAVDRAAWAECVPNGIVDAMDSLDTAHPGWRDWLTVEQRP